jgi:hypothetical protein
MYAAATCNLVESTDVVYELAGFGVVPHMGAVTA